MTGLVTEEEMIRSIRGHLPQLLRSDPSLGDYILSITREHFPSKVETEDQFTRMLNELARDREAQSRKWEEQKKVRFYDRRHHRQADRMIVVSPMIDDPARRVGAKLGTDLYPDSLNVPV